MKDIDLYRLDLGLLRVFDALLMERSVTRAGEQLGLAQSTVSHSLARLRDILKDELFLRGPGGMRPTPRAAEIGQRMRQALLQLRLALEPPDFTPALSTQTITIACGDYTCAVLLPRIMERLRAEAPRMMLNIRPLSTAAVPELDEGRIDFVISSFGRIPERFAIDTLLEDRKVWVMRADHPDAGAPLTLDRLAALPHLIVNLALAREDEHAADGFVVKHGLEQWEQAASADYEALFRHVAMDQTPNETNSSAFCRLMVPNFFAALSMVSMSDMVVLLPECFTAVCAQRFNVRAFDPPYEAPPGTLSLLWHRDHGSQSAIRWFRQVLIEVASASLLSSNQILN